MQTDLTRRSYGRLPILILLMTLVILIIGAVALHYVENRLVATTGESLALAAGDIADMLDRLLFERYSDIPMMCRAQAFQGRDVAHEVRVAQHPFEPALRAGDVWVEGSRRYADPETYLIPRAEWPARIAWWTRFLASIVLPRPCAATRITFSRLVRKSRDKTRSTVGRSPWAAATTAPSP